MTDGFDPIEGLLKRFQLPGPAGARVAERPQDPVCPICAGTHWVRVEALLGDPGFGEMQPCPCWEPDPLKLRENRLLAAEIPPSLSFENFEKRPKFPAVAEALKAALAWAYGEGPLLLVLFGHNGVGKSHLAAAAGRRVAELGEVVLFREEMEFFEKVRQVMRDEGDAEAMLRQVCETPWLVWDDLGKTPMTPWVEGALPRIIQARWRGAVEGTKRTLLTTNVQGKQLPLDIKDRLGHKGIAKDVNMVANSYRTGER